MSRSRWCRCWPLTGPAGTPQAKATDSAGSRFAADANKLVDGGRFDELITLLASHIDRVTSAGPKGAAGGAARARATACAAAAGAGTRQRQREHGPLAATMLRRRGGRAQMAAARPPAPAPARALSALGPPNELLTPPPFPRRPYPLPPPKKTDAECCLALMAHLVKKVTGGEEAERAAAGKLAAALSAKVAGPGSAGRAGADHGGGRARRQDRPRGPRA
jgi:hypothetical protein